MKTIAFFNNKGGVGKTTLVYHLAWVYADLGISVIAADLDPQANLTSMFLEDDRIETLWADVGPRETIYQAFVPLLEGTGDIARPHVEEIGPGLGLIPGDLSLSIAEDELSSQWSDCLDRKARAFRVITAVWRVLESAALDQEADIVLIDVGSNLGALNRAVLVSSEYVVIPLAPELFSLQGLKNLGPTLRRWREEWQERRTRNPAPGLSLPPGDMRPAGYVVMQPRIWLGRPPNAYIRWMERIPFVYRESVLDESGRPDGDDTYRLAALKHYGSLMPLAQEARKPVFSLAPADGAIGSLARAVQDCYFDFRELALSIALRCGVTIP